MSDTPTTKNKDSKAPEQGEITPIQALNNLYMASKMAPLTANDHEVLKKSAVLLQEFINGQTVDSNLPVR